jgi:hypothetical protein
MCCDFNKYEALQAPRECLLETISDIDCKRFRASAFMFTALFEVLICDDEVLI